MWFVANILAVSSRHEGRRTKMLVGRSLYSNISNLLFFRDIISCREHCTCLPLTFIIPSF